MSDKEKFSDDPVIQSIYEWRNKRAAKLKIHPTSMFRNSDITTLAKFRPTTLPELYKVPGFPENGERCKKYGATICEFFKSLKVDKLSAF